MEVTDRGQLVPFFRRAALDSRIGAVHISLFASICVCGKDMTVDIPVTRRKLMALSRIASSATYHRCIRDLVVSGYIVYEASYHPKGSIIRITV